MTSNTPKKSSHTSTNTSYILVSDNEDNSTNQKNNNSNTNSIVDDKKLINDKKIYNSIQNNYDNGPITTTTTTDEYSILKSQINNPYETIISENTNKSQNSTLDAVISANPLLLSSSLHNNNLPLSHSTTSSIYSTNDNKKNTHKKRKLRNNNKKNSNTSTIHNTPTAPSKIHNNTSNNKIVYNSSESSNDDINCINNIHIYNNLIQEPLNIKTNTLYDTICLQKQKYEHNVLTSIWYGPLIDGLRSISIFLPNRFTPDSIISQTFYTFQQLQTHYHSTINGIGTLPSNNILLSGYLQDTYHMQPNIVLFCNRLLFILGSTECLLETISNVIFKKLYNTNIYNKLPKELLDVPYFKYLNQQYNDAYDKFHWKFVTSIELFKFILRLLLIYSNNGKMLTPSITQNDNSLYTLQCLVNGDIHAFLTKLNTLRDKKFYSLNKDRYRDKDKDKDCNLDSDMIKDHSPLKKSYKNTQKNELINPQIRSLQAMYIQHGRGQISHGIFLPRMSQTIHPYERYNYRPPLLSIIGEILYWARPSIYTGSKIHFGNQSWIPFIVSLFCDISAQKLLFTSKLSPTQAYVWKLRVKLYMYYIFRSPFFDIFTLSPLRFITKILNRIPGLRLFSSSLLMFAINIQRTYFYTAAS